MAKVSVACKGKIALVQGRVFISILKTEINVKFKIDTGSPLTLLLDKDFLSACGALGWAPYRNDNVLQWILTLPHIFTRLKKSYYTISGKTNPIFRINSSFLWLLRENSSEPPDGWTAQGPVHGTFSTDFLKNRGAEPSLSLLGSDKLRQLRRISWTRRNSTVKFVR